MESRPAAAPIEPCPKCNVIHDPNLCKGHSKGHNGAQCGNKPMHGQVVCHAHGGRAAQNRAAGATRVAEEKVRTKLGKLVIVPVDNPLEELRMLAGEAAAWKRLCAEHVAELERLRYSTDGGEQIRGEIQLFERAIDRCHNILVGIARLNLDERIVRITEQQVNLVKSALQRSLGDIGLPAEQQQLAMAGVARYLRPSAN